MHKCANARSVTCANGQLHNANHSLSNQHATEQIDTHPEHAVPVCAKCHHKHLESNAQMQNTSQPLTNTDANANANANVNANANGNANNANASRTHR